MVREVYRAYGLCHYPAEGRTRNIACALSRVVCFYGRAFHFAGEQGDSSVCGTYVHRMFGMVRDLLHTDKDDDFNKLFSRIEKYENISDSMELRLPTI